MERFKAKGDMLDSTFLSLFHSFLHSFTPSVNRYLLSTLYWKVTLRQKTARGARLVQKDK